MPTENQRQRLIEASSHTTKRIAYMNMSSKLATAHMEKLEQVIQNIKTESPECFQKEDL